jgi:hypothetical protein
MTMSGAKIASAIADFAALDGVVAVLRADDDTD